MSELPRLYAVLGHPVGHSKSPAMHTAAFAAMGLPHRYVALDVPASRLSAALAGVRALGLSGVNLTVPHKEAALAEVDEVDDVVRAVGAINTVSVEGQRLLGTNTDVAGFAAALRELADVPCRRAVVLGGGGAARAIVAALLGEGADVQWISRRPRAVVPLGAAQLQSWLQLDAALDGADVLVNATTVGMMGGAGAFPCPVDVGRLVAGARVLDAVYPRPSGGLLDLADAAGHRTQDGRAMLRWQGVFALQRWLGRPIPREAIAAMQATLEA
jgi:shikimate dehydrogenase